MSIFAWLAALPTPVAAVVAGLAGAGIGLVVPAFQWLRAVPNSEATT